MMPRHAPRTGIAAFNRGNDPVGYVLVNVGFHFAQLRFDKIINTRCRPNWQYLIR
jgi:hypothetical protein